MQKYPVETITVIAVELNLAWVIGLALAYDLQGYLLLWLACQNRTRQRTCETVRFDPEKHDNYISLVLKKRYQQYPTKSGFLPMDNEFQEQ